ncbi:hypothetical protein M422DRAFT_272198 [Sphaerobolus stellatus SS14]|uniref:Uncharacterized protein n=1 Tax=Sphaerobolus stellatus (strain SS14) TaxID=990650 RepID=A0A0C9TXY0_SPHS4|nr:hypothetical protein M422DRAFT_272198 [Sphaerobolus stellatus SS14]
MAPYMQAKPPINTHNRTYVNLLKPQTDIQRANNEYTTYDRFKVSKIPHIHFAHLQGGINVWIAFPRMTNKQQDEPYFTMKILILVQDHWFAFILIPAIKRYMVEDLRNMSIIPNRSIRPEQEDQIHTIIREERDEDLNIFGDHQCNDPFEVEPDVIPALDFDYMSKPENAECVVDRVDASFAKAATNTPSLFNVATLADYGAVSAEYPIDHAEVILMRYCMPYNLIFEMVRGNIQFPENDDAYAANGTFHASINQIINLYTDAKQSSYGGRDELRASIQTVTALLPVANQKMAAYVNAKTVIWIPSRIYFDFWIRHMKELKFQQTRVAKQRPSNACNLTLLNMYLIKSIVTNPSEDSKTRFVLQDLNFQPSEQPFDIFFLTTLHCHTLAVHQMEQDDDPVIQHVTSTNGKRKQPQKDIKEDPRRTEDLEMVRFIIWLFNSFANGHITILALSTPSF